MIDAHHHLWRFTEEEFSWIDSELIRCDFLASDLDAVLVENQVSGAVAVQARCSLEENEFLLSQASLSPMIQAVVGWVDLKSAEVGAQLDECRANPVFKGVREITQGASDAEFFEHPRFHEGIRELTKRDLSYDVLIFQDQMKAATRFIDQHPEQRFVLDHAGKPVIQSGEFPDGWERNIREMAQREHLVCKVSGLVTEVRDETWDDGLMQRYFDVLLESFGPQRLMFGSDWPVSLTASSYTRWRESVQQYFSSLTKDEQAAVHTETARTFYQL